MAKTIKSLLFLCFVFLILVSVVTPLYAADDEIKFVPQVDIGDFKKDSQNSVTADSNIIYKYIANIYNYAIGAVGILATVVLMFGGFRWITAGGNAEAISDAKGWIGAALTGLVLALTSYVILYTINPAILNAPNLSKVQQINNGNQTLGRCRYSCLPGPYCCDDNVTKESCTGHDPSRIWEQGQKCDTP